MPSGSSALDAEAGDVVHELLVNKLEALAIILVLGFAMGRESVLEAVNDGDQAFDNARGVAPGIVGALFFNAFAVVVEIGLTAHECLAQFVQVASQLRDLRIGGGGIRGELGILRTDRQRRSARRLRC